MICTTKKENKKYKKIPPKKPTPKHQKSNNPKTPKQKSITKK